ncbi:hypothetical protein GCM10027347_00870 [Larkinella harenae]
MTTYFDAVHEDTDLYSVPQVFRKLVPVSPVRVNEKAPLFSIHRQRTIAHYNYSQTASLHDWLQAGPLVVAFYSAGWNRYGKNYLPKLIQLHTQIQEAGGNLLVLSPDSLDSLQTLADQHDLTFTIAQDVNNQIAEKFGVYSTDDPVWNWIAGITEDVPYPALFVVAPDRQIQFSYIDKDFTEEFPAEALLNQVQEQQTVALGFYNRKAA